MRKSQPIEDGKFNYLCPVCRYFNIPVKDGRELMKRGLIPNYKGRVLPEEVKAAYRQYAHLLAPSPQVDGRGARRPVLLLRSPHFAKAGRSAPSQASRYQRYCELRGEHVG